MCMNRRLSLRTQSMRLVGAGLFFSFVSTAGLARDYIVKVRTDKSTIANILSDKKLGLAAITRDQHAAGNLILISPEAKSTQEESRLLAELLSDPRVEYVVENKKVHRFEMPNDPQLSKQWSHEKVRASAAWDRGAGSKKVVIAVTDTGVDHQHADLKNNIWTNPKEIPGNNIDDDNNGYVDDVYGYDFKGNDADPMDETGAQNPGHGTHCAGILGAVGNNNEGISGMSQVVSIMGVRFLGADGSGDLMGAVKSIDYAINNGANIISASWGAQMSEAQSKPVTEAIGRANDKGVIFVAAAANDGKDNDTRSIFPANTPLPNVISVAASDVNDGKPTWSNYGIKSVHVSSPGLDIWSTMPANKYGNLSGTSMATPLVSGLVGLMVSHNPKLTGSEARAILQSTGTQVAIETACECRVDAANAVDSVLNKQLTVIPQAATISPTETLQFSAIGGAGGYKFESSASSIASIDANGLLTATATGEVNVTVTDSAKNSNTSLRIRIVEAGSGGGGGGGGDMECPLDPTMCEMMCQLLPDLPWCAK
jgi:thermitase